MKTTSRTQPLLREDDGPEMKLAVKMIRQWGYRPLRPNPYQLKIDDINYYPSKGSILIDGGSNLPKRGLNALRELLESRSRNSIDLY